MSKLYLPLAGYLTGVLEEPFDDAGLLACLVLGSPRRFSYASLHSVGRKVHCVALLDAKAIHRQRPVGTVSWEGLS